jgi:hypothetical protein
MWEIAANSVGNGSCPNLVGPGQPSYVDSPPTDPANDHHHGTNHPTNQPTNRGVLAELGGSSRQNSTSSGDCGNVGPASPVDWGSNRPDCSVGRAGPRRATELGAAKHGSARRIVPVVAHAVSGGSGSPARATRSVRKLRASSHQLILVDQSAQPVASTYPGWMATEMAVPTDGSGHCL